MSMCVGAGPQTCLVCIQGPAPTCTCMSYWDTAALSMQPSVPIAIYGLPAQGCTTPPVNPCARNTQTYTGQAVEPRVNGSLHPSAAQTSHYHFLCYTLIYILPHPVIPSILFSCTYCLLLYPPYLPFHILPTVIQERNVLKIEGKVGILL